MERFNLWAVAREERKIKGELRHAKRKNETKRLRKQLRSVRRDADTLKGYERQHSA